MIAIADMYEPNHLPVSFCRFNVEQLMSSHFAAAAANDAGLTTTAPVSPAEIHHDDIASPASASVPTLQLNHSELWKRFSAVGTEMVITKSGRHVYALCT